MIIKLDYEVFDTAMATVSNIISDRALQEDLKNLVVWVKDGNARFAGYNGKVVSATNINAHVEYGEGEGDETLFMLRAKDIVDVLTSFKGLRRTKVASIELHIRETEAVMHVIEIPIDETMDFAEEYNQVSKFRITKPVVKEIVKREVQGINMNVEGTVLNSSDVLLYINALLPTVVKETRESTWNVMFREDYIYTALSPYTASMPNKLPEVFSGFRLSNSVVSFLKNFISMDETFVFDKQPLGNGGVILTLKVGESVAVIKCADMSRAFDITNYTTLPDNGIVVDRGYLMDVLKRMSLSSDASFVEVDITKSEDGSSVGTMRVVSKNMTQQVPVVKAKGEGKFSFNIRSELLSSVVFSHAQDFGEAIFLYFATGDRNNIIMGCTDSTQLWQTMMTGLSPAQGDFAWG